MAHVRMGEKYAVERIFRVGGRLVQGEELFAHVRRSVKQYFVFAAVSTTAIELAMRRADSSSQARMQCGS